MGLVRINLRLKILVYSSGLLVLLVTATLAFVNNRAAAYANEQIAGDLEQVRERITRIENERRIGLLESASLIASFPQLRALLATDTATVADFLVSYQQQNLRSELIVAIDRTGQIIARTDLESSPRDRDFHSRWIEPVLERGYAEGIFSTTRRTYDAVAVAAQIGGEVFGFILAAAPIDDAFALQLGGDDSEVVLIGDDILGSTLDLEGLPWRNIEHWTGATSMEEEPREVYVMGERFIATAILVGRGGPPVLAVVMQSWDRATEPYRNIQIGLLVLGLLITSLGVGGSAWLAKTITAPVATLVEGTKEVARGNLDYRLNVNSSDEIGDLADSFNAMLDERQRLERQFQQSQKLEAVGWLAGGVAHDFNNLLTVITGRAEILMRSLSADHPIRRDVGLIHDSSARGSTLTRQLLAFSRKQILQPRVLNLEKLILRMEPMLKALVEDVVDLRLDFFPALRMVKADPGQIEQVVMNLSVNARDAMPNGGRLTIATEALHVDLPQVGNQSDIPAGKFSVLSVSDTGTGIEDEVRDHLFEPFFTTKESGKGTGLGLSTVYGIVQQTGGHIDVASQLGRGTTFRIYLPAVDEVVTPEDSPVETSAPGLGTETILVVEDEKFVRDLVQDILESSGYFRVVQIWRSSICRATRTRSEVGFRGILLTSRSRLQTPT